MNEIEIIGRLNVLHSLYLSLSREKVMAGSSITFDGDQDWDTEGAGGFNATE